MSNALSRKRIKSLALLRYGDTSVRLSSPAVDYILSAQYSPTRHTSDGISPAVIIEETEMTYTAEPTSVPEPQRAVWEILAKSPSYEMRKTAAGRGLKVETFIELLSDRAFSVRETVLDNIDGLETLASTEGGRKALALALKDRMLRNTVRHRIRDIDEQATAVLPFISSNVRIVVFSLRTKKMPPILKLGSSASRIFRVAR